MICITQQRDIDLPQSAILPRHVLPVPKRVLRIHRNEHDVAATVLEFLEAVLEREHLGRADEGEGCRDEENHEPGFLVLVDVCAQGDFCDGDQWWTGSGLREEDLR